MDAPTLPPPPATATLPPDIPPFDFHTHNADAPAGRAVVCLPAEVLLRPDAFRPRPGVLYAAGVHPWWCGQPNDEELWAGVEHLARSGRLAALGECGYDRLHGDAGRQDTLFRRHARLADELGLPLTVHCVRAFDRLLAARRELRPTARWTLHGFRGKPALARQLLAAGFDLSFGPRFNADSLRLCPPERLHIETDDTGLDIETVHRAIIGAASAGLPQ